MKKNAAIVALIATALLSFGFAYKQRQLAGEYQLLAIENEIKARENMKEAVEQKEFAGQLRMEAEHQRQMATVSRMEALKMKALAEEHMMQALKNEELARTVEKHATQQAFLAPEECGGSETSGSAEWSITEEVLIFKFNLRFQSLFFNFM
jgi:hypothetical protein